VPPESSQFIGGAVLVQALGEVPSTGTGWERPARGGRRAGDRTRFALP